MPGHKCCALPQVLSDGGRNKLIPGRLVGRAVEVGRVPECASNVRTASRSSCARALTAQLFGANEGAGNVPGMLMDIAQALARWFLRAALRFE
jgi:hypothetical protein